MGKKITRTAAADQEPFAPELALALDDIERLTLNECGGIIHLALSNRVEPVLAFLAMHVKLSFVLCAPHGKAFADALRAWGANASIERKIREHWPRYRSNWKAGRTLDDRTIKSLCNDPVASWLIGVRPAEPQNLSSRPIEMAADMPARLETLERLTPGTVFRIRNRSWSHWSEMQVVKVSSRGNFHLLRVGSSAKNPDVWSRKLLCSSEWSIEIVG